MRRYLLSTALAVGLMLTPLIAGAQSSGSIARAVRVEAARLTVDAVAREGAVAAVDQDQAGLSSWASVAALNAGSEVLVARAGREPAKYRLLSVQDDGLTILDVSSSTVPPHVARRLRGYGRGRPGVFRDARNGREVALTSRISIGPSGVSQQGRVLFPLSLVVIDVPRADVDAVSVIRKHVGQHVRRGMVIGAVAGAVWTGVDTPDGWMVAGGIFGGIYGLPVGALIGLIAPPSPDLVYRRWSADVGIWSRVPRAWHSLYGLAERPGVSLRNTPFDLQVASVPAERGVHAWQVRPACPAAAAKLKAPRAAG